MKLKVPTELIRAKIHIEPNISDYKFKYTALALFVGKSARYNVCYTPHT